MKKLLIALGSMLIFMTPSLAQDCLSKSKDYRTDEFDPDDFEPDDRGIKVGVDLFLDTNVIDTETLVLGLDQPFYVDYLSEGAGASHLFGFFFFDIDTDKDGSPDFFETGPTSDLDGDGYSNADDDDDDGDGILDVDEGTPAGVTSMPASYFRNGTVAAANSLLGNNYWQFVPNSVITEGTYKGYFEHPGAYLYVDNDGNEIPDVLEYNTGKDMTPPYVTDKGYQARHKTKTGTTFIFPDADLGVLGNDWVYQGTPGDNTADKYHWLGSTIFYIADDDGGTDQTSTYANSPYYPSFQDSFNTTDAAPDYLIYGTDQPDDARIPEVLVKEDLNGDKQFIKDGRGQEMYKYRWYESNISGARELVFFLVVFYGSGSSNVNTYYSKSAFNKDNAPGDPTRNGATNGDQFGRFNTDLSSSRATNWYAEYRDNSDHDDLANEVWGFDWIDIASKPTDGSSPVLNVGGALKNPAATQAWVDEWENWRTDRRILQYRALRDWFSETAVDANDVIQGRYGINMSVEGDSSLIRAINGNMAHLMVGAPSTTKDAWLLGWEDLYSGGDRDYEDVVFYVKRRAGGELVSYNVADDIGVGAAGDADYSLSQVSFTFEDNFVDSKWGVEGRYIAYFYRLSQEDPWTPLLGDDSEAANHHLRTVDKFQPEFGGSTTEIGGGIVQRTVVIPVEDKKDELYWSVQMASEDVDATFQPLVTGAVVGYQSLVHDFYYNSAVIPNSNINYFASHETPLYSWNEQRNRGHLFALQSFIHGNPPHVAQVGTDDSPEENPTVQPTSYYKETPLSDAINLYKWDAGVSTYDALLAGESRTIYSWIANQANTLNVLDENDLVKLDKDNFPSTAISKAFAFSDDKTSANVWVDNYHDPAAADRDESKAALWLINWIHGQDDAVISNSGVDASTEREWVLGGINRASPVVVRAPGRPTWLDRGSDISITVKRSYLEYAEDHKNDPTRILIGTDSGLVHCLDAGTWIGQPKVDPDTNVEYDWAEGHYKDDNYGTGKEIWAMVPGHMLDDIKYNYTGANDIVAKSDATGVSTVVTGDGGNWQRVAVFVPGYKGGTQVIGGNDRIGNVVWALDITDVDSPKPLWQRSDANTQDLINPVAMGWVEHGSDNEWAVVYPSGGTPVSGKKPAFTVINALTGALIKTMDVGSGSSIGTEVMMGTPALVDQDGNGYIDHIIGATSEGWLYAYNTVDDSIVYKQYSGPSFYIAPNVDLDGAGNIKVVAVSGDNPLYYDEPTGDFTNTIYYLSYNPEKSEWTEIGTIDLDTNHKVFSRPKLIDNQLLVGTTTGDTFNFCDFDPNDPGDLLLYDLTEIGGADVLEYEIDGFGSILAPIIVADGRVFAHKNTSNLEDPNEGGSVHRLRGDTADKTQQPAHEEQKNVTIGQVFGVTSFQDDLVQSLSSSDD